MSWFVSRKLIEPLRRAQGIFILQDHTTKDNKLDRRIKMTKGLIIVSYKVTNARPLAARIWTTKFKCLVAKKEIFFLAFSIYFLNLNTTKYQNLRLIALDQ